MQKIIYFPLIFYVDKRFILRYVYIQKALHFALHLYMQKTIQFALRFISKIYRIVLMPKYKRMYDQSDQIGKKI